MRVVRLPEERNMNRLIDIVRLGARRDNAMVIIERHIGNRRVPVLEVTPEGDLCEVPAARLRTTIGAHMSEQHFRALTGQMNKRATAGHFTWERMVRRVREAAPHQKRRAS